MVALGRDFVNKKAREKGRDNFTDKLKLISGISVIIYPSDY